MTEFYYTSLTNSTHWNPYHIIRNNIAYLIVYNKIEEIKYFHDVDIKKQLLIIYD